MRWARAPCAGGPPKPAVPLAAEPAQQNLGKNCGQRPSAHAAREPSVRLAAAFPVPPAACRPNDSPRARSARAHPSLTCCPPSGKSPADQPGAPACPPFLHRLAARDPLAQRQCGPPRQPPAAKGPPPAAHIMERGVGVHAGPPQPAKYSISQACSAPHALLSLLQCARSPAS